MNKEKRFEIFSRFKEENPNPTTELVYHNPVSGGSSRAEDNMFALHRRVIDPSTTFNQIMGEGNQETFTSWDDAIVTPVVTTLSLDPYPAPEDSNNYLAGHVANFIVDFYVVDDEGDEVTQYVDNDKESE